MEIQSINNFEKEDLRNLFSLAYEDYPYEVQDRFETIYQDAINCNEIHPISFVASDRGQNVGILLAKISEGTVDVRALAVIRSHRKVGVATLMLNQLLIAARKNKLKNIKLEVLTSNKDAFKLYTRMDFYVSHKMYCFQGFIRAKRFENLILNKCFQSTYQTKSGLVDCYISNYHNCNLSIPYEVLDKDQTIGYFCLNENQTEITRIQAISCERSQLERIMYAVSRMNLFLRIINVPDKASVLLEILMNSEMKLYCDQYRMNHELI